MKTELRVFVVDDEEDARSLVKLHLSKIADLTLVGEAGDGREALDKIAVLQPDIVLLDIQMPEVNGVELVETCDPKPHFIFITAYDEYALKAFELNAVDYLLKPFSEQRFVEAMQRAKEGFSRVKEAQVLRLFDHLLENHKADGFPQKIAYKNGLFTVFIEVKDILAVEAADQYVNIITAHKKHLVRHSMDYMEKTLDPEVFFRSHRSAIVRLSEVVSFEQVDGSYSLIHLKDGTRVKLSQTRKEHLKRRLANG